MPCYSRIESRMTTKLEGMSTVEQAAKLAGYETVTQDGKLIVHNGRDTVVLETVAFQIEARSYSGRAVVEQFLKKIMPKYGEIRLKQFAQKRGYTISRETPTQTVSVRR